MEFLQGKDEAGEDVREGRKSGASSLDDESQRWGKPSVVILCLMTIKVGRAYVHPSARIYRGRRPADWVGSE